MLCSKLTKYHSDYEVQTLIKDSLSQPMDDWANSKFIFACVKQVFVGSYLYENLYHLYIHSHENQVSFMWNVLHEHSF